MQAYKCDECNQYFEGDSSELFSAELGDRYEVQIRIQIKWTEEAKAEEVVVEKSTLFGGISFSSLYGIAVHTASNSRDCDLCPECAKSIAKAAMQEYHLTGERVST